MSSGKIISITHAEILLQMHRNEAAVLKRKLCSGNSSPSKRIKQQEQLKRLRTYIIPRDEQRLVSLGEQIPALFIPYLGHIPS